MSFRSADQDDPSTPVGAKRRTEACRAISRHSSLVTRHSSTAAALACAFLPLLFFPELLFQGQSLYFADLNWFHYPLRLLVVSFWKAGVWPLWNPYAWNGYPLLAYADPGALSPLNALFLLPVETYQALNGLVLLHIAIAGLGAYALARQTGISRGGAGLAALSFAGGGHLMASVANLNIMIGLAWAPLIWALLISATPKQRAREATLGGLALALQIYSSHPQAVYFTVILLGSYALADALRGWRPFSPRPSLGEGPGAKLRALSPLPYLGEGPWAKLRALSPLPYLGEGPGVRLRAFAWLLLVGVGLSAPQWITTLEAIPLSVRAQGLAAGAQTHLSLPPDSLMALLFPRLFFKVADNWRTTGIYDEFHFYLGLIPLVCVALAALAPARGEWIVRFSFVVALGSLILALGHFTPVYGLLSPLALFSFVRAPGRWLFITAIVLIVLVGKGADAIYEWARTESRRTALRGVGRYLTVLFFALSLTVPVGLLIRPLDPAELESLSTEDVFSVERIATRTVPALRLLPEAIAFAAFGGLALTAFWLLAWQGRKPRAFAAAALTLTAADLFLAGGQQTTAPAYWQTAQPLVSFLKEAHDPFQRIFSIGGLADEVPRLGAEHPSIAGVFASSGYELALGLQRSNDYMTQLPFVRAMQLSSTRWLVSADPPQSRLTRDALLAQPSLAQLPEVWRGEQVSVREIPAPLPRAYVAYRVAPVGSPSDALERLRAEDFDAQREVVVEDWPDPKGFKNPSGLASRPSTPAQITRYAPDDVQMAVDSAGDGLFVLTDTDYPGWRAWVDGVEQPILRANFLFRGIIISAGLHTVEFRYEPFSFRLGLGIAGVTLALMMAAAGRIFDFRF
ncbi:MAG: YfhO family protein [Chloroflexi bacterium]|nr:YfhO family protein [Chloroflexota bacterium]